MAKGSYVPAQHVTQVVETVPEKFVLELSASEAQVLNVLLAHCRDIDPEFPEPRSIYTALKDADVPEYFGVLSVVDDEAGAKVSYRLKRF